MSDETEFIDDGEDTTIDRLIATLKNEDLPDDPTYTKAIKSLDETMSKTIDETTD
ncbi:MAG: hypothetical protein WC341_00350 [Bacteroidales bacterium]|jgi:hypothetical protein